MQAVMPKTVARAVRMVRAALMARRQPGLMFFIVHVLPPLVAVTLALLVGGGVP